MSFTINTNMASLQAQLYLQGTNDFQSKTLARVTSGLRIVQAGDDAAGLAIANGYRSDQAVLTQGVRNANDALSQLQIMDGGMSNISKLLDRARTLATQSASDTFSGDRTVLNNEFSSIMSEIDRQAQNIGLDTNGQFAHNLTVFVGGGKDNLGNASNVIAHGSVTVDLSNSAVDTSNLGLKPTQTPYSASGSVDLSNFTSVLAGGGTPLVGTGANGTLASFTITPTAGGPMTIVVDTANVTTAQQFVSRVNSAISDAAAYSPQLAAAGITAGLSASGDLAFSSVSDQTFKVAASGDTLSQGVFAAAQQTASAGTPAQAYYSILDKDSATSAVTALSTAVANLGRYQADVGKGENVLNYAVNLAQSQTTNMAAAESRIRDADLASEAANMTKAQILLQAGVAALAQANSAPQQVLTLLRS
jgi:flagellin